MSRDDIIRMAREAGCVDPMVFIGAYERFAALVAAAERELLEAAELRQLRAENQRLKNAISFLVVALLFSCGGLLSLSF